MSQIRQAEPDLTAAARIRNTAIELFARDGFDVGLRAIAAEAGVTAGLITHHFGSKDGLRQACDAETLRLIAQTKRDAKLMGGSLELVTQMAEIDQYAPAVAYIVRSLIDGGTLAKQLLDTFIADAEEYLAPAVAAGAIAPSHDEAARVRYLTYSGLGALLLYVRYEAPDPTDIRAVIRNFINDFGPVTAELYSQPLIPDPNFYAEYAAALQQAELNQNTPQEEQ